MATFSTTILQSATGYRFAATAAFGDAGVVTSTTGSNLFDVLPWDRVAVRGGRSHGV
ncbi:MAG: hypothetical protein IPP98_10215 [Gemmatimonadetes bacterium]|nr:hypothetical protein [Gemmatimonadota bacterium]